MNTTTAAATARDAEITGVVTHSATLWAPVVLIGYSHGRLLVETLTGGVGGWSRKGKRLTVAPHLFEQD